MPELSQIPAYPEVKYPHKPAKETVWRRKRQSYRDISVVMAQVTAIIGEVREMVAWEQYDAPTLDNATLCP